ncbi:MAG: Glu/Leu/Phe/Val dehydrogenase [Betaproteobacteria bacterium]|nr:MAG: Glu/Leu/Phe/Val dehydrogenase [Betaproteobacteria bacterium]
MEDAFKYADEFGPLKIIHIYEPSANLKAVLVIDNVARGPSIGGLRMAPDVSTEECFRLARAMTFKNSAADLPHGGGKMVIYGDPAMDKARKEQMIRALAKALRTEETFIFGPDMGTNEECMAWIHDEIGRSVGLPRAVGGIPLDEIGATGWGLSHAVDVALPYCDFALKGARVAVQGFGAVGSHAARFLAAKGAILVAASDSQGAIHNAVGIDVDELTALKASGAAVTAYKAGDKLDRDAVIDVECDIWIPAARPDVVNEENVHRLNTRLVVEGANIPFTEGAEKVLHDNGVLCVPDFIANAGGVICAAMEYQGAGEAVAFQTIGEKVRRNTKEVLEAAQRKKILPRTAAVELAAERVRAAMGLRRYSLFSSAPGFI